MFKHCVWYKITNNYINGIIRYLAIIFNTSNYNAHLTVEAFMDNDNALTLYNIYIHLLYNVKQHFQPRSHNYN